MVTIFTKNFFRRFAGKKIEAVLKQAGSDKDQLSGHYMIQNYAQPTVGAIPAFHAVPRLPSIALLGFDPAFGTGLTASFWTM